MPVYGPQPQCSASSFISHVTRRRELWDDASVKTFVCELQVHHEVSDPVCDAALITALSNEAPASMVQAMLPSKVFETGVPLQVKSLPQGPNVLGSDTPHHRYVKMRDTMAK